jgi:hypothetical protein
MAGDKSTHAPHKGKQGNPASSLENSFDGAPSTRRPLKRNQPAEAHAPMQSGSKLVHTACCVVSLPSAVQPQGVAGEQLTIQTLRSVNYSTAPLNGHPNCSRSQSPRLSPLHVCMCACVHACTHAVAPALHNVNLPRGRPDAVRTLLGQQPEG